MSDNFCVVCLHREPTRGYVCDLDRERMAAQLADMPRKIKALTLQLVPGGGAPLGERVSASRTGSPTGARLGALSLTGPGSNDLGERRVATLLHPLVRKWCTVHTVTIDVEVDGQTVQQERKVLSWEQQLVHDEHGRPVRVMRDDQVGVVPPVEWLDSWVGRWLNHFNHAPQPRRGAAKTEAAAVGALARLRREDAQERRDAAMVLLGLREPWRPPLVIRDDDPLAEEWELRFGQPGYDDTPDQDAHYLRVWLDQACDVDLDIAEFAAGLRALTAELTQVLGEQTDVQWLGRCPTPLTDAEGVSRPCGAGLWQDPYVSQIECPRCRSTWGQGNLAWLKLAGQIRRTWPVVRRRRYTLADIEDLGELRRLRCPGCGEQAEVVWQDVTGSRDRERWWRPAGAVCPAGCPDAGRLV